MGQRIKPEDIDKRIAEIDARLKVIDNDLTAGEAGLIGVAQGVSYGFSDEAIAGGRAAFGSLTGDEKFSDLYGKYKGEEQAKLDKAREQYPLTTLTGEFAGAGLVPFGTAKAGVSLAGRSLKDAIKAIGKTAGESALSAAGESREKVGTRDFYRDVSWGTAIGTTLGGILEGLKQTLRPAGKVKPNAEEIKKATQEIGGEATPGMLRNDPGFAKQEAIIAEQPDHLYFDEVKGQREKIKEGLQTTARNILANAGDDVYVAGGKIQNEAITELEQKLEKTEKLWEQLDIAYDKLNEPDIDIANRTGILGEKLVTKGLDLEAAKNKIRSYINSNLRLKSVSGSATGIAKDILDDLDKVKTMRELTEVRSALFKDIADLQGKDTKAQEKLRSLYDIITEARSDQLKLLGEKYPDQFAGIDGVLKEADNQYAHVSEVARQAFLPRTSKKGSIGEVKRKINELAKPELLVDQIINDQEKAEYIRLNFPKTFEIARQAYIKKIEDSVKKGDQIQIGSLLQTIRKMNESKARLVFGDDALNKKKAMEIVLNNFIGEPNPSGSGYVVKTLQNSSNLLDLAGNAISAANDAKRVAIYKFRLSEFANTVGKAADSRSARGLQSALVRQSAGGIVNAIKDDEFNQPLPARQ